MTELVAVPVVAIFAIFVVAFLAGYVVGKDTSR